MKASAIKTNITKSIYGQTPEGQTVELFILENSNGLKAKIITYGATLTELHTPDKQGKLEDIVLGFDDLQGYLANTPYLGCTIGRVANVIAKSRFTLKGKTFQLVANNGVNFLHGGRKGFDRVVWSATSEENKSGLSVILNYTSKDGEDGFPGTLETTVKYTLTNKNELQIKYTATCDQSTPVNLTNHSYFNLAGSKTANILNHELYVNSKQFAPGDVASIPTGKFESVKGSPFDFLTPRIIGEHIKQIKSDPVGYNCSYLLSGNDLTTLIAKVKEPLSGRIMEVYTTEPSVQFYTGNFLNNSIKGKGGTPFQQYQGFCLETQHLPDSINQPNFPTIVLEPGSVYRHTTIHKFLTN